MSTLCGKINVLLRPRNEVLLFQRRKQNISTRHRVPLPYAIDFVRGRGKGAAGENVGGVR